MRDPYQDLAEAIVLTAVKDYRDALKKLKKRPKSVLAKKTKKEEEKFFRSDWCSELTTIDGEFLIKKLQAEGTNNKGGIK